MAKQNDNINTAKVTADKARIDRLKERQRSTPQELDFERIRIMKDVYEETAGDVTDPPAGQVPCSYAGSQEDFHRRQPLCRYYGRKLYGYLSQSRMERPMDEGRKTVENSKTPEDKEANSWALNYWDKRGLKSRTESIFQQRYGFNPSPAYQSGLVVPFHDWPGGGGNLNYPLVYQQGLASVIKDVEERMMSLEMRLENTDKLYFYQSSLIVMKAIIRWANRYAALAREMAENEKDATRKAELISIAETCEWVPEHPARNLREAIQCHFMCHLVAELPNRSAAATRRPTWVRTWNPITRLTRRQD